MSKIMMMAAAAVLLMVAGCQQAPKGAQPQTARANYNEMSPDEQIIQDAADAGGIVVSNKYSMPTTAADRKAKPDDILYDASGEPYRIVKKLGAKDEQ